jgi:hypothetical protein
MDELIKKLKELASTEIYSDRDELCPSSLESTNVDDAYSDGYDVGQVTLARELLELLN